MTREQLREQIIRHEGTGKIVNGRMMPYTDTTGNLSIGYGRNLRANGIRPSEAAVLLENDITDALNDCLRFIPTFDTLDTVRQAVLTELMFNMGWPTLKTFKATLAAIERRDFEAAADGLRNSKWYRDVKPTRGDRLVTQMRTGLY